MVGDDRTNINSASDRDTIGENFRDQQSTANRRVFHSGERKKVRKKSRNEAANGEQAAQGGGAARLRGEFLGRFEHHAVEITVAL